jgi:hypothetical protein
MFASASLIDTRERAAVLALMTRKTVPWNRLAGAIEEEGSALRFLEQQEDQAEPPTQLFRVEEKLVSLDQMEGYVQILDARESP